MPPKRKSRAAASKRKQDPAEEKNDNENVEQEKTVKKLRTEDENEDLEEEPDATTDQPAAAAAENDDETNDNQNADDATPKDKEEEEVVANAESSSNSSGSNGGSSLAERMKKLQELKRRRVTEVEQGNRRDRNLEFQRSKENPRLEAKNARKREAALKLLEKQKARDNGEDYERKQFWKYSAESVEKWNEKMERKAQFVNHGFTDYEQEAHKKYLRLIQEMKPDMTAYNEKKLESIARAIVNGEDPSNITNAANDLDYGSIDAKPSEEAIDRLVKDVEKQIRKRENRSRDRKEVKDDISWINEKNRVFNQKIARFYDKYTKEIRENLERGTAL